MAGVGARGIRIAKEVEKMEEVTLVDFNKEALKLARRSASLNGVGRKCSFSATETSAFLSSRGGGEQRFDYVDVDPFGTPIRHLQAAICATTDGGVMSVTATDTAVLCGVYPEVSRRRYGASTINNRFNHETGIRVLAGAMARTAAQLDMGVEPVAAHSTRHYIRVFARVRVGAARADEALRRTGQVAWCPACGHARTSSGIEKVCERCGRIAKMAGPMWVGAISDQKVVASAGRFARGQGLASAEEVMASLAGVNDFPPWCFSIESVCSSLGVATVPEDLVYRRLLSSGYRAMRTPFEKTGVKTNADYRDVVAAIRGAAKGRA